MSKTKMLNKINITERKKTEVELSNIFTLSPDMIWTGKLDGTLTKINPASKQILGYEINEMIGKSFLEYLHPEDLERTKNELDKALMGVCDHYIENRYRCKNGDYKWIAWTALSIKSEEVFYAIGRNITERKQAEEKIRILNKNLEQQVEKRTAELSKLNEKLEKDITERKKSEDLLRKKEQQMRLFMLSTNDSIWNWDMVAGTVERSIGFERAFGYAIDDIHSDIEWWVDRLHPDDKERVWQTFDDVVASGKAFCGYEYRFRCRDGSYANIEDSVCIIRDDTGKAVRSLGAMRNITERKKAEEILQEQKKALEQKNIALGEILGQLEIEKKQIKDNVIANAETMLLPIIEKMSLKGESSKYAQLLQRNLQELTSSFGARLSDKKLRLTSREIDICNMIKNGLTSKEIAGLLNISLQTIEKHRAHIRKKLGIVNRKLNLSSALKAI